MTVRELLVKVSLRLGLYKSMMRIDNKIQMRKQNKSFAKYGLQTLDLAVKAAKQSDAQLFLAFGTLLGAYRNKGFIPYDCDLDTGMLASQSSDLFVEKMIQSGFVHKRRYFVKESNRVCEDKFQYKGVSIDVHYFYTDDSGALSCELCLPHESKDWRSANATDGFPSIVRSCPFSTFSEQQFLGVQCYMPDSVVDWLKALYGENFMVPNPNWSMSDHQKRAKVMGERLYRIDY